MKSFLFCTILCFSAISSFSQNSLGFRAGNYLWGSGDLWVPSLELEVRRSVHNRIDIGASLGFGHYSSLSNEKPIQKYANSLTAIFSDQTIGFTFIKGEYLGLRLVAGTSVRYFNQLQLIPNFSIKENFYEEGVFRSDRYIVFGVIVRPEIYYNITKKDRITIGLSTTPYTQSEISSGLSVAYSRLFTK